MTEDDESMIRAGVVALMDVAHRNAIDRGWWDTDRNEGELIALAHSELSEALEALRTDANDHHIPELKGVEVELADAVIRIFDHAEAKGYRLAEAIIAKMEFNTTRPARHGGKKF